MLPLVIVPVLFLGMSFPKFDGEPPSKHMAVFTTHGMTERVVENAGRYGWATDSRDRLIKSAEKWLRLSDGELHGFMFGSAITRSWMVWSDGFCPFCKNPVPMYTWKIDGLNRPWKVQCPHCGTLFPTNDFEAFYRSGLDRQGVFDPQRADRSLL